MKMTEGLFDNIINTAQDCVFWKDKERRFVGVNQAFLDFYGFESADVLIGKTDEDMGWHSDPEPYMQDEIRVLEGHSTYKVQGKCVIRGEERDIIASKRPIYEGDKIVGLVGSFVDITEVLKRNNASDRKQRLYTREELCRYHYFDTLLNEYSADEILDPLTGLISRGFFLDLAKSLIAEGTPFSFSIIDLDNFKYINDTYGHHTGDEVLADMAKGIADYVRGFGLAGRFGGDELLLINFRDLDYIAKEDFFEKAYGEEAVLRKRMQIDDHGLYITATTGCATFPADADNYDTLFSYIDKTLYRGKTKGRNCYTVYSEALHKNLDMQKLARQDLYTNMSSVIGCLGDAIGFRDRALSIENIVLKELNITEMLYCGKGMKLRSTMDMDFCEDISDIEDVMGDDEVLAETDCELLKEKCPRFYEAIRKKDAYSVLAAKIGLNRETDGYLVFINAGTQHVWKQDEIGLLYFAAKSLAGYLRLNDEKIPE